MPLTVDLIPFHMVLKAVETAVFRALTTLVTVFFILFQMVEMVLPMPLTMVVTVF